jgi:Flp pilus assembly protein TadG
MKWRSRCRGDRGVTIVEAAFVVPLLFLLVLGMMDIAMWEFQNSQASNAARDGARVGILSYTTASGSTGSPGGTDYTAINNAVKGRLGNQSYSLTVTCVGPTDETATSCATANITPPGIDRLKVVVTWSRSSFSPLSKYIGVSQTVTGTAVMQLVGKPT